MDKFRQVICVLFLLCIFSSCGKLAEKQIEQANTLPVTEIDAANTNSQNQSNLTVPDDTAATPIAGSMTTSPLGRFDFKNFTYPLPRGWQSAIREITLENGKAPVSMAEDERKIGATLVGIKYGEVTRDGQDEAFVVIKIETGGSALPQIVYVFDWKAEKPELIWYFRTGDRADGGLRDLRAENGKLVVELYGQDRYIFGEVETMRITGDEEQICCPTYFTRIRYKLTGTHFIMQGKRETFSVAEPNAPPVENMGELTNKAKVKSKK